MGFRLIGSAALTALHKLSSSSCRWQRFPARSYGADTANVLREGTGQLLSTSQESQQAMQQLLERLEQLTATACKGGGDHAVKRHEDRGKLPPRERIVNILDTGAPFLELSHLAGHNLYGAHFLHCASRAFDRSLQAQDATCCIYSLVV